ncbi:transposase [Piscirickettsia salmonis]|uniref:transposase n=1 Tax=Piscirickettsia salmonis TaxID=1238 RepID=UPI00375089B2
MFYAWLVKDLLPKLPAHSVIVMDNARFHKRSDMIEAIEEQGHTLEYLPSYSPDLNPIERKRKRRYLGRYFAHPMMQNRRAKRDDYKPSAVRVTQRYVP